MSRTSSDRGARRWRAEPSLLPVVAPPSGHVFCVQRQRGLVWYAKYRTGTGRQIQKKLGPAWKAHLDFPVALEDYLTTLAIGLHARTAD